MENTKNVLTAAILIAALLFALPKEGFGQSEPKPRVPGTEARPEKREKAAPGTFQIVIRNKKSELVFANELLEEIEKRRDPKNTVYWRVNYFAEVKILPRETVESKDFRPLEKIVYLP